MTDALKTISSMPPPAADGLPDFAPRLDNGLLRPYWESLERGKLCLPACSLCGAWQWYPYEFVKCHADATHVWKPVASTGVVYTFATAHRGFLPNADPKASAYVAALIEIRVRLAPQLRTGYVAPAFEPVP